MNRTLAKRLNSLEARLSPQKEPLMLMRVIVAPDRDISPEITGIECNGEILLHRLPNETRESLHECAFAHFKPIDTGVVVQLREVF